MNFSQLLFIVSMADFLARRRRLFALHYFFTASFLAFSLMNKTHD